jgi:hypothetical protein
MSKAFADFFLSLIEQLMWSDGDMEWDWNFGVCGLF